jgi:hypothetical protein
MKNRERAMQILKTRLFDLELQKQQAEIAARRKSQVPTAAPSLQNRLGCGSLAHSIKIGCNKTCGNSATGPAAGRHRIEVGKDQDVQLQGQQGVRPSIKKQFCSGRRPGWRPGRLHRHNGGPGPAGAAAGELLACNCFHLHV